MRPRTHIYVGVRQEEVFYYRWYTLVLSIRNFQINSKKKINNITQRIVNYGGGLSMEESEIHTEVESSGSWRPRIRFIFLKLLASFGIYQS